MGIVRTSVAVLLAALVAAGCGTTAPSRPASSPPVSAAARPSVIPVLIPLELGVGPNRVLFGVIDSDTNEQIADPERTMSVGFTGPAGQTVGPVETRFIWAIENERGVYAADVEFPASGAWTAIFETAAGGAPPERIQFGFDVKEETQVLRPGDPAPSVDTPTADDVGGDLSQLSTDEEPEPRFYEASVADALAAGEPFVLAFATPSFCATDQCGPTLDRLKPLVAAHPDITFINVEPYELESVEGRLQPVLGGNGQLQAVQAVRQFGLSSEPYVFVVDADGIIRASFEMIFSEAELEAAIEGLG